MLTEANGCKRGMTVVELLVVLAAGALVAAVGMKLVHICLAHMAATVAAQQEAQAIWNMRDRLQMAWDQRLEPWEGDRPWLELEGTDAGPAYALRSIRIRCAGGGGEVLLVELHSEAGQWLLRAWPEFGPVDPDAGRAVGYAGPNLIDVPGGRFSRNEGPESVWFRFPDAGQQELRQGFAIRSYW